jgi:hypothetical protein
MDEIFKYRLNSSLESLRKELGSTRFEEKYCFVENFTCFSNSTILCLLDYLGFVPLVYLKMKQLVEEGNCVVLKLHCEEYCCLLDERLVSSSASSSLVTETNFTSCEGQSITNTVTVGFEQATSVDYLWRFETKYYISCFCRTEGIN